MKWSVNMEQSSSNSVSSSPEFSISDFQKNILSTFAPGQFQSKLVLVTGGSRGIGRAICLAFGALGAKVVVNYAGNDAAANETAELVKHLGGTPILSRFNVSSASDVQGALSALEKEHGGFDILVNNAGVSKDNLFVRMKEEEWDANLNTNLKGCYLCTKALTMGMMKKRSGKIVNISSVIGLTGNAGQAAYAASKAGILGLTKSLAKELASRNIQVNAVAPGYITTDMTSAHGEKLIESVLKQIPAEKLGEPADIAKMVLFLSSQASNYITGQTFAVDGGMTMH
jgi:3-oxoacyl-[acyl-carrier protein] reductase